MAASEVADEYLYRPVLAGFWKQRELWDGTYTFEDLVVIHEAMDMKQENEFRIREALARETGAK